MSIGSEKVIERFEVIETSIARLAGLNVLIVGIPVAAVVKFQKVVVVPPAQSLPEVSSMYPEVIVT